MRKKVFGRHLSRGRKAREALFRSLIRALVLNGKIVTTKAKAKAIVPLAESLVVSAKEGSIASRRRVLAALANDREVTDILFSRVAPAFTKRTGGFTKIILLPPRRGDAAEIVTLEWVEKIVIAEPKKEEKTKKEEKKTTKTKKTASKSKTK